MKRSLIYLATILILTSCGTGLRISKSDFQRIDNHFSGTFSDTSFKSKGKNYQPLTLTQIFEVFHIKAKTVSLQFNDSGYLQVSFNDSVIIYHGKFKKRGYYEFFLSKRRIAIPPLIPFIYGSRNIDRIRIGLTKNNALIVYNWWVVDGNLFLFAGGGGGWSIDYFNRTGN